MPQNVGRGWFCRVAKPANSLAFLELLLDTHPKVPCIAVVLDNVVIHQSRSVQAWLLQHPRRRLLYNNRYSPREDPVERIWGAVKRDVANSPPPTIQGRVSQALLFFASPSPEQILRTAAPWRRRWLATHYGQLCWRAAQDSSAARSLPPGSGEHYMTPRARPMEPRHLAL